MVIVFLVALLAAPAAAAPLQLSPSIVAEQKFAAPAPENIKDIVIDRSGRFLGVQTLDTLSIVEIASGKVTATISNLTLIGTDTVVMFGSPCLAAAVIGAGLDATLTVVACQDGREVASSRLLPKQGNATDVPRTVEACSVLIAQTRWSIAAYDLKTLRMRRDILRKLPLHFADAFTARSPDSCAVYFASNDPGGDVSVRLASVDVRKRRAARVADMDARPDAERPLLFFTVNGAASPSGRFLAIPTLREDVAPKARPWNADRIEMLDRRSGRFLPDIRKPIDGGAIKTVVFLDDESLLLGTSGRGTFEVWPGRAPQRLSLENDFVLFDYALDARRLAAASAKEIRVYDLARR
ncbi:MAG: hypothetical protein GC190_21190 [Alphaproteobacteria bacterium]|nr:hypothetical protein [Alphaproteobacteria bacterium]